MPPLSVKPVLLAPLFHGVAFLGWCAFASTPKQKACMDSSPSTYLNTYLEPYTTKVMTTRLNASSTLELHFLDVGHPEHQSLTDQFTSKWQHKNPAGGVKVVDIIKIEVGVCVFAATLRGRNGYSALWEACLAG